MRIGLLNHQRLHLPRDGRPASSGSIGHWHFEVATRLAAGGDEVLVVGPKGGRLEVREQEYAGVRFVDLPDGLDELAERLRATLRPGRSDLCADTSHALFARRAARLLAREGVDAVVVTNRSQYLRPLRRRLPDARLVLHMQCEWLTQLERSRIVPRLALADRVTACSRYLTERIATAFPEYAARCGVVHNGVDLERFQPGSGDGAARLGPRLVFSGRLSPEKGVHHLVEAFARVVRDLPDARRGSKPRCDAIGDAKLDK